MTYSQDSGKDGGERRSSDGGGTLNVREESGNGQTRKSLQAVRGGGEDGLDLVDGLSERLNGGVLGSRELYKALLASSARKISKRWAY